MRQYPLPPEDYEKPSSIDHPGNRTDKAMTIGIVGAGIIAALILIGSLFMNPARRGGSHKPAEHAVAADDNTTPQKVQE